MNKIVKIGLGIVGAIGVTVVGVLATKMIIRDSKRKKVDLPNYKEYKVDVPEGFVASKETLTDIMDEVVDQMVEEGVHTASVKVGREEYIINSSNEVDKDAVVSISRDTKEETKYEKSNTFSSKKDSSEPKNKVKREDVDTYSSLLKNEWEVPHLTTEWQPSRVDEIELSQLE